MGKGAYAMRDATRRDFLRSALACRTGFGLSATKAAPAGSASAGENSRPNVLLIMTDTQRLDDMGAYGNALIRTPNLDRLANGGVKFTHCYTQYPACMPMPAGVQGKSLRNVLTSDAAETGSRFAYTESISSGQYSGNYLDENGKVGKPVMDNPADTLTIRDHRWRMTFYTDDGSGELYDLEKDPHEFENRWSDPDCQKAKAELMPELLARLAATRDPLPQHLRPY
jgi:hypothetical protein